MSEVKNSCNNNNSKNKINNCFSVDMKNIFEEEKSE